jgi:hypothetical protein
MRHRATVTFAAALLAATAALAPAAGATTASGHVRLFVKSALESPDQSVVTLPLRAGTSHGERVWYVVLDASTPEAAAALGVNYVPKLANARGTAAVQQVQAQLVRGVEHIDFPATVDFSPRHVLVPGPTGFPPRKAAPGAVGEPGYSPLIELPDGTVLDAPQVANASGRADKIESIDRSIRRVVYRETEGRYDHHVVHYISTDASASGPAAIEDVTYAPALDAAPSAGDESDATSSREGLIAFTNGQTGVDNPQRQGLSSALLDHLSPLNILHEVPEANPSDGSYSPLWDIHLAEWTPAAVAAGENLRQDDFAAVLDLIARGIVTGPGGSAFGPSGFVVTCPIISENL